MKILQWKTHEFFIRSFIINFSQPVIHGELYSTYLLKHMFLESLYM